MAAVLGVSWAVLLACSGESVSNEAGNESDGATGAVTSSSSSSSSSTSSGGGPANGSGSDSGGSDGSVSGATSGSAGSGGGGGNGGMASSGGSGGAQGSELCGGVECPRISSTGVAQWCRYNDEECGTLRPEDATCLPLPPDCLDPGPPVATCRCDGAFSTRLPSCAGENWQSLDRCDRFHCAVGVTCDVATEYCTRVPEGEGGEYFCVPIPEECGGVPSCECLNSSSCDGTCSGTAEYGMHFSCNESGT
jgi:hypothetical protein